ncbi:MAG: peptide deformylase [Verrucomicrobia bacterium]|nr:peptide deformylase [Verrucomicrobiota bacterium]
MLDTSVAICGPLKEITQEIHQQVQDLKDTTLEHNGAGMATVQLGVRHRVFILSRYALLRRSIILKTISTHRQRNQNRNWDNKIRAP